MLPPPYYYTFMVPYIQESLQKPHLRVKIQRIHEINDNKSDDTRVNFLNLNFFYVNNLARSNCLKYIMCTFSIRIIHIMVMFVITITK